MHRLLDQHANLASFLVLFLEDLGIPVPVPADVVIMYNGYRAHQHLVHPLVAFLLMLTAVNVSASILFMVIRRGGRPLVGRYGTYLHLGPERLARAEAWIKRRGPLGLILIRSIPGLRVATVVTCGLLDVPFQEFFPVQVIGTGIYISIFFLIGYFLGPQVAEQMHVLGRPLRLLFLVVLAVALPLLLRTANRRTAGEDTAAIALTLRPGQRAAAALFGGFAGLIELTVIWTLSADLTHLMQRTATRGATEALIHVLLGPAAPAGRLVAYGLGSLIALPSCLGLALLFFLLILPRLHLQAPHLGLQAILLWLLSAVGLYGAAFTGALVRGATASQSLWGALHASQTGALTLSILGLGLLGFAYVAAEAHRLAVDRFDPKGQESRLPEPAA